MTFVAPVEEQPNDAATKKDKKAKKDKKNKAAEGDEPALAPSPAVTDPADPLPADEAEDDGHGKGHNKKK